MVVVGSDEGLCHGAAVTVSEYRVAVPHPLGAYLNDVFPGLLIELEDLA